MREVEKSRTAVFFPMFCGSRGSKSRLAEATGAERSGRMRDQELHWLWREANLEVKIQDVKLSSGTLLAIEK